MKKLVVLVLAIVMVLSLSTTALANVAPPGPRGGWGSGWSGCPVGGGMALMWDDSGNFISRADFEQRVDDLIASGVITSADKDALMDRYDWCAANGIGAGLGGRGCGGGRGGWSSGARGWSR